MIVRPLTLQDVPAALRLSTQAGWNQVEADWQRLIRLWPDGCFAGWVDGQLVATGTLATYADAEGDDGGSLGRVGWIGMILVDESHRKKGLGTAIMRTLLARAEQGDIARLGLDASDLGEPIYRRLGFETCLGINRWSGRGAIDDVALFRPDDEAWSQLLDLDRRACRVDRGALIREIVAGASPDMRWVGGADGVRGYGIVRKGRIAWHVGPLVADDVTSASRVLDDLIGPAEHNPFHDVFVDVPDASPLEPLLRARGFAIARRLRRMCRPPGAGLLTSPCTFAAAGFELG